MKMAAGIIGARTDGSSSARDQYLKWTCASILLAARMFVTAKPFT
jgi:hypothetical protein